MEDSLAKMDSAGEDQDLFKSDPRMGFNNRRYQKFNH